LIWILIEIWFSLLNHNQVIRVLKYSIVLLLSHFSWQNQDKAIQDIETQNKSLITVF